MIRTARNSAADTVRPVGYGPGITRAVTLRPVAVVVRRIHPTTIATVASTTPAQVGVIWRNRFCSIGFHLHAPGGSWHTVTPSPVSSANSCDRNWNRRDVAPLLPPPTPPVLTTDRYAVYGHLPADRRQVCWAHRRRDFQAMTDRTNGGSGVGADLLPHADILFDHWERVRDGTRTRRGFRQTHPGWLRAEVRSPPDSGAASPCSKTAATCREILGDEATLGTSARVGRVEPTNDAAERAIRHAGCWRKTNDGSDSEDGSRFVEKVPTVVASGRQQGREVLGFLVDTVQAAWTGATPPSLVPAGV